MATHKAKPQDGPVHPGGDPTGYPWPIKPQPVPAKKQAPAPPKKS